MTLLLPARTTLPQDPLTRTHAPGMRAAYSEYRACLRWEFGFTCSICFLHETDFFEIGTEGTGLIWIEHHQPQSLAPSRHNEYSNCILTCRFCNNARQAKPNIDGKTGAILLNPTMTGWSQHFSYDDDSLVPSDLHDKDAIYTYRAYHLGDRRKVELRRGRARAIAHFRRLQREVPELMHDILAQAKQSAGVRKTRAIAIARALLSSYETATSHAQRFCAVPRDAPEECMCTDRRGKLPAWLKSQCSSLGVEQAS